MFLTKPILTRREPPKHEAQRATPRIKLHKPLIKLIKKDQGCYSVAPSTTNQNATQRIYIKYIEWLGNPYRHTVLKCSMKVYLKVIGCSCYTCLSSYCSCYCSKWSEDDCSGYWYWGSSDGSASTHEHMAKTKHNYKHTSKH